MTAGRYTAKPEAAEKLGSDRPSLPPSDQSLSVMTAQYKAANDRHEAALKRVGGEPLPAAVAVAALDLEDESRVAVCRELRMRAPRVAHEIAEYEREALGRIAARSKR